MIRLIGAVVLLGLLALACRWLRSPDPWEMSADWRSAHADREDRAGAPWVGVSWKRPYRHWRDGNGRYNRRLEQERRDAAARKRA